MTDNALRIVAAIRARHDGRRRNPFREPECGHHYGRALAAYNVLLAWTGFRYSAMEGVLTFGLRPGHHFWESRSHAYSPETSKNPVSFTCTLGTIPRPDHLGPVTPPPPSNFTTTIAESRWFFRARSP